MAKVTITARLKLATDLEEKAALKQRLSKTRQIQQCTMQELLTGKTRLLLERE